MYCFAILLMTVAAVTAISIEERPTNYTVEVGSNHTLKCRVTNKGSTENVFWKLHRPNTNAALITLDKTSKNTEKYTLGSGDNNFDLHITNITSLEGGTYECEAGTDDAIAALTVTDYPEEVTLTQTGSGCNLNFTCVVKNSLPPATVRWYVDNKLHTGPQQTTTGRLSSMGYGTVTDVIGLELKGSTVKCSADLADRTDVDSASISVPTCGAASTVATLLLVTLTLLMSRI